MHRLLADIGGTHARFALAQPGGGPEDARTLRARDHADVVAAAETYLQGRSVELAVFAINGPVEGDTIQPTNTPWPAFSIDDVTRRLGLTRLVAINDFVAQALAIPRLDDADRVKLGGGEPVPGRPIAVLGPGTGLGVAALLPAADGFKPVPSEAGHISFAPHDEVDLKILERLWERYGHISNERVLAGDGLANIARALAEIDGAPFEVADTRAVIERAKSGGCRYSSDAAARWSRMLGAAAGDLALTFLAFGGIYLAGGMCRYLGPLFDRERFRAGFIAKGRFDRYLEPIPTWLVTREHTGLLGAAACPIEG